MSRMNHVNTHAEVIEAFRVFDKDGSGTISRDELYQILTDLGEYMDPKEIEELLYDADFRQDGHIDYETFVNTLFAWD